MALMNANVQAMLTNLIETVHSEGYPSKVHDLTGPIYKQFGYSRPIPKEVMAAVGALFSLFRGKVRPQSWLRPRSDLLIMIGAIQEEYKNQKKEAVPSAPSSQPFYSKGFYPPSHMYYPTPLSQGFYPPSSQDYYYYQSNAPSSQMMEYSEAGASQQLPEPTYASAADIFIKEEPEKEECPIAKWNQEKKIFKLEQENEHLKEQVERLQMELHSKDDNSHRLANLITQKEIEIMGLREQTANPSANRHE